MNRVLHEAFAHHALFLEHFGDALVGVRFDETKGQVFQLPLELPDAQAVRERRVQVQRFTAISGRHVVEQLKIGKVAQRRHARRQAHQHHPHVAGHGQQHLAQRFNLGHGLLGRVFAAPDLLLANRHIAQPDQLAHAGHQIGRLLADTRFKAGDGLGIEHGELEHQAGDTGFGVAAQKSQRTGHAQREFERVLARGTGLVLIGFAGIGERRLDPRRIDGGQAHDQLGVGAAQCCD